ILRSDGLGPSIQETMGRRRVFRAMWRWLPEKISASLMFEEERATVPRVAGVARACCSGPRRVRNLGRTALAGYSALRRRHAEAALQKNTARLVLLHRVHHLEKAAGYLRVCRRVRQKSGCVRDTQAANPRYLMVLLELQFAHT